MRPEHLIQMSADMFPSADIPIPPKAKKYIAALIRDLKSEDSFTSRYAEEALLKFGTAATGPLKRVWDREGVDKKLRERALYLHSHIATIHREFKGVVDNSEEIKPTQVLPLHLRRPKPRVLYVKEDKDQEFTLTIENHPHWEGDSGRVYVYAPSGKRIGMLRVVGTKEKNTIKIPADGETGVYRVSIRAGQRACWNVGSSTGKLAVETWPYLNIAHQQNGRYYFRVPEAASDFSITLEALNKGEYAGAILTPDGKAAASTIFTATYGAGRGYGPGLTGSTMTVRPPEKLRGKIWSVVIQNAGDVVIRMSGVPTRIAIHPGGVFDVPEKMLRPRRPLPIKRSKTESRPDRH